MFPGIRTRIIYDFLVVIQGSYMISLVLYKDRIKKSSMDSMKSYDPCMKSKKLQPGKKSRIPLEVVIETKGYLQTL